MAKREFAPGLPDPRRFGRVTSLPTGTPLSYVIQRHLARRAGSHYDLRFGPNQGNKPSLLSWAARKLPVEPGQKTMAFQQPLHTGAYSDFEGEIVSGYGKGMVKTHDKGQVIVTNVSPNKITFVVAHKKHPEKFTLIRKSGRPMTPQTAREAKTQGGTWLLVNTTPTDVIEHKKVHYAKVPAKDIAKLFDEDYLHSEKIDGAAALYKVLSDRIEVLSYRPTTAGRPIVHTYRVGGTSGINIPKHLVGSVLRGEIYGVRHSTGRAIPPQELGGILNSSTIKALRTQKERGIELRNRIFNILQYGKKPVGMETPYPGRIEKIREILQHAPSPKFSLPDFASTPEEQKALWERVSSGKRPLTREGIVAWPKRGGKPTKVKLYDESDVFVREIFPGTGKLKGVAAGGFGYSLKPRSSIVGRVGSGLSDETRKQMWETPEEYVGRIARIQSQGQFPSGAHRAPSLIALHEDYPAKSASLRDWENAMARGDKHPAELAVAHTKVAFPMDPRLAASYAAMQTPKSIAGAAGELGSTVAFMPAARSIGTIGSHVGQKALGRPTAALGGKLAARWAPKALAKGMGIGAKVNPYSLLIAPLLEVGLNNVPEALQDPRYKSGEIGFTRALGGSIGRGAEAMQAKTQEQYEKGLLRGAVTSGVGGVFNPVANVTGFGQAAWRAIKSPFQWLAGSKKSSYKVLAPFIKLAVEQLGGEGETMEALVKAAQRSMPRGYPPMLPRPPVSTPEPVAPAGVTLGNRIRGLFMGMDPKTIQTLQGGARSLASVIEKLKLAGLMPAA